MESGGAAATTVADVGDAATELTRARTLLMREHPLPPHQAVWGGPAAYIPVVGEHIQAGQGAIQVSLELLAMRW